MVPQAPQVVQCRKNDHKVSNCEFPGKGRLVNNAWELEIVQLPLQIPHIDKIPPGPYSNQEMMDTSWWVGVCRLASFWVLPYRIHGTAFLGFSSAKGLGFPPSNPWLALSSLCNFPSPKKMTPEFWAMGFLLIFSVKFHSLNGSVIWLPVCPVKLAEKSPASCAVSQARRVIFGCLTMYMYYVCKLKVISKIYTVCINV